MNEEFDTFERPSSPLHHHHGHHDSTTLHYSHPNIDDNNDKLLSWKTVITACFVIILFSKPVLSKLKRYRNSSGRSSHRDEYYNDEDDRILNDDSEEEEEERNEQEMLLQFWDDLLHFFRNITAAADPLVSLVRYAMGRIVELCDFVVGSGSVVGGLATSGNEEGTGGGRTNATAVLSGRGRGVRHRTKDATEIVKDHDPNNDDRDGGCKVKGGERGKVGSGFKDIFRNGVRGVSSTMPELEEMPLVSPLPLDKNKQKLEERIKARMKDGRQSKNSDDGVDGSNTERQISGHDNETRHVDQTTIRRPKVEYTTDIEPAFSDPKDYPSGWLIYDPVRGVIPKEAS